MSSFLKIILGVFLSIAIVFSSIGVISANNDAKAASSYLKYVSNEISTSNFSENVINELITEAQTEPNDYILKVYRKGQDSVGNFQYAAVELTYKYRIPLLGVESEHIVKQIAR